MNSFKRNFVIALSTLMCLLVFTINISHVLTEAMIIYHIQDGFALLFRLKIASVVVCLLLSTYFPLRSLEGYLIIMKIFVLCHVIFSFYISLSLPYFHSFLLSIMQINGDIYCTFSMMYFWQLANDKFEFSESKYFYPLINLLGTISLAFGHYAYKLCAYFPMYLSFTYFSLLLCILGFIKMFLFNYCRNFNVEIVTKNTKQEKLYINIPFYGWCIVGIAFMNVFCQHIFEYFLKVCIRDKSESINDYLYEHGSLNFHITLRNIAISIILRLFIPYMNWMSRALVGPILNIFTAFFLVLSGGDIGLSLLILGAYNSVIKATRSILIDPTINGALLYLDTYARSHFKRMEIIFERLAKIVNSFVMLLLINYSWIAYSIEFCCAIIWFIFVVQVYKYMQKNDQEKLSKN